MDRADDKLQYYVFPTIQVEKNTSVYRRIAHRKALRSVVKEKKILLMYHYTGAQQCSLELVCTWHYFLKQIQQCIEPREVIVPPSVIADMDKSVLRTASR